MFTVQAVRFEPNDLWPRYLARWFILTPSRSTWMVKVTSLSSQSKEENVAKLVREDSVFRHAITRCLCVRLWKQNTRHKPNHNIWWVSNESGMKTYYRTIFVLLLLLLPTWVSRHQKSRTILVKPIRIYRSKRQRVAVSSAGPYANLHLAPDR